jgi:hypothetical protein
MKWPPEDEEWLAFLLIAAVALAIFAEFLKTVLKG